MTGKAQKVKVERAGGAGSRAGGRGVRTPAPRRAAKSSKLATPEPIALEYAEDVAARVRHRPVPIRNGFIERLDPADTNEPILARLLRGGQGGAVRIKLYLSLIWFSVTPPHATAYPARSWAALLGLPQHETNGARRISAALDWLDDAGLVVVEPRPGAPSRVVLRDERGNDELYEHPHDTWLAASVSDTVTRDDYYVKLPHEFWTKGWLSVLSGPAVAMLLIMTLEARYSGRLTGLWHSPTQFKRRFDLSPDTRKVGLAELTTYGILDKRTQPVSPGVFDKKRRRNIYDLHLEQLTVFPGESRPSTGIDEVQVLAPETVDDSTAAGTATSGEDT